MKPVKVRNLVIGKDQPKVIVPLMATDIAQIIEQAELYAKLDLDIVEWRADYFDLISDLSVVKQAGKRLREIMPDVPILFTFRTAGEGGVQAVEQENYIALNRAMIESGLIDLVDIELFTGDVQVKSIVDSAHVKGVKVIASNHDFQCTPSQEEIIKRLCHMQNLGADILKIAVMPNCQADVLTLLGATLKMYETYAQCPLITMSMGAQGVISRLAGEAFGSAATFAAAQVASAPGQMNIKDVRTVLDILHR